MKKFTGLLPFSTPLKRFVRELVVVWTLVFVGVVSMSLFIIHTQQNRLAAGLLFGLVWLITLIIIGTGFTWLKKLFQAQEAPNQTEQQYQEQLSQQHDYLAALHTITHGLLQNLDPTELLNAILMQAIHLAETEHGCLDILDSPQNMMKVVASKGRFVEYGSLLANPNQGISGQAWASGETYIIKDYRESEDKDEGLGWVRTSIAIPLKLAGDVIGIIGLAYEKVVEIEPEKQKLLEQFANLAALALQNARLYASAQKEIIERKQTEDALRTNENRLQAIYNAAKDGLFVIDMTGHYVDVNPVVCTMFGYTREEILAADVTLLSTRSVTIETLREQSQSLWQEGGFFPEISLKKKDGSILWVSMTVTPFTTNNGKFALGIARDITSQRETQAELLRTKTLLQAVFNQSPEGMLITTVDGRIEMVNQARRVQSGVENNPKVKPGVPLKEIKRTWVHYDADGNRVPAEDLPLQMMLRGEDSTKKEVRIVRQDGSEIWELTEATPVYDDEGKQIAVLSISTDITQRKVAEQERERLLALEREQRLLAETLADVTLVLTAQVNRVAVYDAILDQIQRLVPYSAINMMLRDGDLLRTVYWRGYDKFSAQSFVINHTQQVDQYVDDVRAFETRRPVVTPNTYEASYWTFVEETQWIHSHIGMPIVAHDQILGLIHIDGEKPNQFSDEDALRLQPLVRIAAIALENTQLYHDLEQRVEERTLELQAEKQQTDTILQNIADAVVFTDMDAHILYVNPAWEVLNGYSSIEVLGKNPRIIQSDQTSREIYQAMWHTILAGKTWRGHLRNKRKDGSLYDAELTVAPVTDDAGEIQFFVGIERDVTEARKLETMKTRFVANAAHDLNNPISSLNLRLDLLKRTPERLDYHVDLLEGQLRHLTGLVKDLLTLSRLDRDGSTIEWQQLNINTLIAQVIESQQPLAATKHIILYFQPGDVHLPIWGDWQQIERVVMNLVINALNYSLDGSIVTVKTAAAAQWVYFSISDTGIGIEPNALPHLFERFYRGDNARKAAQGTGLGLSIVKEIIDRHHGEIEVSSVMGEGTYFRISLPQNRPE